MSPSRRTLSPRHELENAQAPKSNERPSSEIDIDEVLRLAREADEQAQAEPEPPKRKPRKHAVNGENVREVQVIETDPEFVEMCKWGVGSVVDIAHAKLDWSDPGIHWKDKVSTIVARIIQRLQPMEPSLLTDCIILGGYTALWAIPNVSATIEAKRTAKNPPTLRNDWKREDTQAPGTLTTS